MAADMQRKRSSEGPDGTLAPSDGQSVERAESPTPGLAQGMEPGTGRVLGHPQPAHSQSSLLGLLLPQEASLSALGGLWGQCPPGLGSTTQGLLGRQL